MDYKELLKNRRSVRDYKDEKIDKVLLDEIINDASMAPSASNRQPWRFIIIEDKKLMQRISCESKKNILAMIAANPDSIAAKYKNWLSDPSLNVFYNAPCLIIITGKIETRYDVTDCALAASYLMFAATERNLGTCWIGLGEAIQDPSLKKEIGLPLDYDIVMPIVVGYPKKIPESFSRREPIILKHCFDDEK